MSKETEQYADNEALEQQENLTVVQQGNPDGIDYTVDFIYGGDQSQYVQETE